MIKKELDVSVLVFAVQFNSNRRQQSDTSGHPDQTFPPTQAIVKKMKENLPIYVMHTMNRMRMAPDFYPRLNVKKLFKLVTMDSFGVEMLNPQLLTLSGGGEVSADDGWEGV